MLLIYLVIMLRVLHYGIRIGQMVKRRGDALAFNVGGLEIKSRAVKLDAELLKPRSASSTRQLKGSSIIGTAYMVLSCRLSMVVNIDAFSDALLDSKPRYSLL